MVGSVVSLDLTAAVVADVARALCLATGRAAFVLSPSVVDLDKRLSLSLHGSSDSVWTAGVRALSLAGVAVSCVRAVCEFSVPDQLSVRAVPQSVVRYRPRFRSVAYLSGQAAQLVQGWRFDGTGAGAAADSGAAVVSASSGSGGAGASGAGAGRAVVQRAAPSELVGIGPSASRARVMDVLPALDVPVRSMVVRVAVYEVDKASNRQSAIGAVASVLGSALSLGADVAAGVSSGGLTLKLGSGGFHAVMDALDSSSLAHLVTAPVLRGSSGVSSSFAVGDSVPTLGSVSYSSGSSTPVQSVSYQQSGVVFSVVPVLVGDQVHLSLYQSVSSFVQTVVGVTSSPTLQNRALSTQLVVAPGAVLVLGGLLQKSRNGGDTGFWFFPSLSKSSGSSGTSIVLVLSVSVDPR